MAAARSTADSALRTAVPTVAACHRQLSGDPGSPHCQPGRRLRHHRVGAAQQCRGAAVSRPTPSASAASPVNASPAASASPPDSVSARPSQPRARSCQPSWRRNDACALWASEAGTPDGATRRSAARSLRAARSGPARRPRPLVTRADTVCRQRAAASGRAGLRMPLRRGPLRPVDRKRYQSLSIPVKTAWFLRYADIKSDSDHIHRPLRVIGARAGNFVIRGRSPWTPRSTAPRTSMNSG